MSPPLAPNALLTLCKLANCTTQRPGAHDVSEVLEYHLMQKQEDMESLRREMDNLHSKYVVAYY